MQQDPVSLLTKYLSGNADYQEIRMVENWIRENEENQAYYLTMKKAWQDALQHPVHKPVDTNAAFNRLRQRVEALQDPSFSVKHITTDIHNQSGGRITPFRRLAIAVVLLLGLLGTLWVMRSPDRKDTAASFTEIIVPPGERKELLLPDGSQVFLNAGSRFRYSNGYGKTDRSVWLEGEGYFSVHHDASLPFLVKAGGYQVRDVGTVFNITAYPGNRRFETAVIEGTVEVSGAAAGRQQIGQLLLNKNEVLKIQAPLAPSLPEDNIRTQKTAPPPADMVATEQQGSRIAEITQGFSMEKYSGWKDNILLFEDETFEEVAHRLERHFGVSIRITSPQLASLHYSGRFKQFKKIEDVLEVIRLTTPIVYEVRENLVEISAAK